MARTNHRYDRVPAHEEWLADSHGWDLLVLAEMSIPAHTMDKLQERVHQADLMEPLVVPDPRHCGRPLFTVRLHFSGFNIVQSFDQSTAEGLFVLVECVAGTPDGRMTSSAQKSSIPFQGQLSFDRCMVVFPEEGAITVANVEKIATKSYRNITLTLVVKQRRLRPATLPAAIDVDRRSGAFCDVTLCVEGQEFPAHRVILAAASDVFRTMFTADFRERSSGRVDITGASARAFSKFLDFLYTESSPGLEDCVLELLDLADLYQVPRLKAQCEERLWMLRGRPALAALLVAADKPVLASAVRLRLCRQVAREAAYLEAEPLWRDLQRKSPYAAGVVAGILDAGGVFGPIMHSPDCPAASPAGQGAAVGGDVGPERHH